MFYLSFYLSFYGLSVEIRDHEVDRGTRRHEVGDLLSAQHLVEGASQRQSHRSHLEAVGALVATAVEIDAKLAGATLDGEPPLALRYLDDGLLLDVVLALRDVVDELLDDVEALVHLVDVDHIARHGVGAREGDLLEVHLTVEVVGMVLAHVVVPASSTSGRTGERVVDGVLQAHWAAVLQTLVGDDVVAEDVEILLYHRSEVLAESLYVLDEVGIDIVLESADAVVALDESASRGLLHDVEQVLTVSHAVEEGRQRAQVLGAQVPRKSRWLLMRCSSSMMVRT